MNATRTIPPPDILPPDQPPDQPAAPADAAPVPQGLDEDRLLADFLATERPLADLARKHRLSIDALLAWALSPRTRRRLALIGRVSTIRARAAARHSGPAAVETLNRVALRTFPEKPESARKAAAQLIRLGVDYPRRRRRFRDRPRPPHPPDHTPAEDRARLSENGANITANAASLSDTAPPSRPFQRPCSLSGHGFSRGQVAESTPQPVSTGFQYSEPPARMTPRAKPPRKAALLARLRGGTCSALEHHAEPRAPPDSALPGAQNLQK